MKRFFGLLTIAAVLLSMIGCDKTNVDNSNSESSLESSSGMSGSSTEQSSPVGGEIGNNAQNVTRDDALTVLLLDEDIPILGAGCGTDEGYYSIQANVADGDFACITYIDYASGQEVILCADSSCKHNTERCTGVIPRESSGGTLFFYREHLYYFITGLDQEGVISAGFYDASGKEEEPYIITPELYRMNPDGTGRELVYTFGGNETAEYLAVGDGDCIWFITKEPTIERDEATGAALYGSKNRAAVRLDLTERKIVEQIPISYSDNITKQFIGVCGRRLIFGGIAYPDGKSKLDYMDILAPSPTVGDLTGMDEYLEFMSRCEYAFFALDVTDKTMREIYRAGYDDISLDFTQIGERLYIPTKDNSAFTLDLNTGETGEFPVPEGYELDCFVGERPLYMTTDGEYRRYFIDPDTGEMKDWLLERDGVSGVVTVTSDSALIYKMTGELLPDGGILNPYHLYAMILLDDLYNERDNFKPIDMLKRSR